MRKAEPVLQAAAIAGGASVATAAATVAQGKVRGEDGGASATGTALGHPRPDRRGSRRRWTPTRQGGWPAAKATVVR